MSDALKVREAAFTLRWKDGAYFVSKPNVETQEVVPLDVVLAALESAAPATALVFIWSGEHTAFWRPDGGGYTRLLADAGRYTMEDAHRRTSHCGPEKQIQFLGVNGFAGPNAWQEGYAAAVLDEIDREAKEAVREAEPTPEMKVECAKCFDSGLLSVAYHQIPCGECLAGTRARASLERQGFLAEGR